MTRDWYNKGYISKDAATNNEPTTNVIAANGALGTLAAGELGVGNQHEQSLQTRNGHSQNRQWYRQYWNYPEIRLDYSLYLHQH